MVEGDTEYGFRLERSTRIEELGADGLQFLHEKSGARLVALLNDDDSKVFSVAFRTPPPDDTGLPHIMEHSVLCGSRRYPSKEPFAELNKSSLSTFLNAFTGPDSTVYPVGSRNPQDFMNLVDVYMDAVFFPRIYDKPEIFAQEGWHHELKRPEGPLRYKGVVYNEMRGAFSSPIRIVNSSMYRELYPDTPYGNESGGKPEAIPDLTYQQFRDFHSTYYHPSNSYIFVYGDVDIPRLLHHLDDGFLSQFEAKVVDSALPLQEPYESMREAREEYPVSKDAHREDATYLSYTAVLPRDPDPVTSLAWDILGAVLVELPGAPLREALLKPGLGRDVKLIYGDSMRQPYFQVCLTDSRESHKETFMRTYRDTLRELVSKGIDTDLLNAGINSAEFQIREARYPRMPRGLYYNSLVLGSWLLDGDPFVHLRHRTLFAELRKRAGEGLLEELIQTGLLDNPHSLLHVLAPRPGLQEERDRKLRDELERYRKSLSPGELDGLVQKTHRLIEAQQAPDDPEALAAIPYLKLSDLPEKAEVVPNQVSQEAGANLLYHPLPTSGIAYLDMYFDARSVSEKDMPYLNLLSYMIGRIGTTRRGYGELARLIGRDTGGIKCLPRVLARDGDHHNPLPLLSVQGKSTVERFGNLCDLISEVITEPDLEDCHRLKEVLEEDISRQESRIQMWGNMFARRRLQSYFSPQGRLEELSTGVSYYRFLNRLKELCEKSPEELSNKLRKVFSAVFSSNRLTAGLTVDSDDFDSLRNQLGRAIPGLPSFEAPLQSYPVGPQPGNEGMRIPAQVQYVAKGYNLTELGYGYSGALEVLSKVIGLGYLWDRVRVQGGAYGCHAQINREGGLTFTSFRDPNLEDTLKAYDEIPEFLRSFSPGEQEMSNYIIGTIGKMERLLSPESKGRDATEKWLAGFTPDAIQIQRDQMLATTPEKIRSMADLVEACLAKNRYCVVGNGELIDQSKTLFDSTFDALD